MQLFLRRTMRVLKVGGLSALSGALILASAFPACAATQTLLSHTVHLGLAGKPEWDVFAGTKPDGTNLLLKFPGHVNAREGTLFIRQDDVKQEWAVKLNGTRLGQLFLMEADLIHALAVPAGTLREGDNTLEISTKTVEDILIHDVLLADASLNELTSAAPVEITVEARGRKVPSRVTILDAQGALAVVRNLDTNSAAVRPGVVYTAHGQARVALLPGEYTFYATRGPEYSQAKTRIRVRHGQNAQVKLKIARVIDTGGWAACDTHIHTFELSRHGDASLTERLMTLAGEGIELAVSTEHNQHADYLPAARALHLNDELTIVPGNEVTTPRGHFNAFPVSLDSPPAKAWITNWPVLWEEIRSDTNVQVVILNHPTDMHSGFTPFARTNLNLVTGRNLRGDFPFQFDAMEVINSGAMRSDWMETFRAWFALLNRGYRITGIGASDSHDVSRFIVGQGRTYIKTDDRSPGRIDIRSACASLREGRAVVSLGLFPQLEIRAGGRSAGPGEMIGAGNNEIELRGSASWPDWMLAGKGERRCNVRIFANGRELLAIPFRGPQNGDYFKFKRKVRRPGQDTWYVMVVDAPGVTNASWAVARPYQPASIHWDPALIGATNPVRVDADNDGKFSAPREIAEGLVQSFGHSIPRLLNVLAEYDWATAVQVAELLELRGTDFRDPEFQSALRAAGKQVEQAFEEYRKALE